jgi:hypothetical protein
MIANVRGGWPLPRFPANDKIPVRVSGNSPEGPHIGGRLTDCPPLCLMALGKGFR